MNAHRASRTAEFVALFRALETARPTRRRFFEDPFAASMLSPQLMLPAKLAAIPPLGAALTRLVDYGWPRTRSSAVARTRHIDDLVNEAVARGARQLLILGAGFDTRAQRLEAVRGLAIFEVDHPATQALKLSRLAATATSPVRFVAVDFEKDDLEGALLGAGFDSAVPTIVIWEGVVSYLTSASVEKNFSMLERLLAPRSRLIFTYVHRGAIDGTAQFAEARRWKAVVRASGEPFLFGFEPSELGEYLRVRGFELASDASTSEVARIYNERYRRSEAGSELYRVAVADRVERS